MSYKEALMQGGRILSHISKPERDDKHAKFMFKLGWIHDDIGDARSAIEYYEQALFIDREMYGDRYHAVATDLNNIGSAWNALDDLQRVTTYLQQAYSIFREFYGDEHPGTRNVKRSLEMLRG